MAPTEFLEPRLTHLHDPSLIPDLDRASARLLAAAASGEPVVIYGDYDVDGVTATAILYHTLLAVNPSAAVSAYVPHRMEEGYGINTAAVEELAAAGAKVIVSVDCGVTAVEPALAAQRLGVDLIITDHHTPPATPGEFPAAYAVVHPRRFDSVYPFGDLCGAGVAYKLAWRMATDHCGSGRVSEKLRVLLVELLAFAALGVIADVVPLVGENRVIARFGLSRMKDSPFIGLRALVDAAGLSGENIQAMDVGFKLGPRLNAAGRMGHARDAVELFTTADEGRAAVIAAELCRLNDRRRALVSEIFEQAAAAAEAAGMTRDDRRAIVLSDDRWHAGVIGIVCSRMVERFCRPTILMQRRGGSCHGSGRSIEGFNIHAALERCAAHIERFGGHDMAAGLHVKDESLPAFAEAFVGVANEAIRTDQLSPLIAYDCEATVAELRPEEVRGLGALAPFGRDNPDVRLLLRGLRLVSPPRPMGSGARHLALQVGPAGRSEGATMRLIAFGWGEHAGKLRVGARIDAVVEPKLSTWNGRTSVEPLVADLAVDP